MSTVGVVLFVVGVVLMYSAVRNIDPRDVVGTAFGKPPKYPPLSGSDTKKTATVSGSDGVTV